MNAEFQIRCTKCGTIEPPIYVHIISYVPLRWTRLCRQCHDEEHGKGLNLIEIFEEYQPIVEGHLQSGAYRADYAICKKPDAPQLTLETLKNYIANLRQRYPDQMFCLGKAKYKGKTLYRITKIKNPKEKPRIPIYFDIENQKFYIENKSLEKYPKLTNYILMVTLGSLGVSQSRYANNIRRAIPPSPNT